MRRPISENTNISLPVQQQMIVIVDGKKNNRYRHTTNNKKVGLNKLPSENSISNSSSSNSSSSSSSIQRTVSSPSMMNTTCHISCRRIAIVSIVTFVLLGLIVQYVVIGTEDTNAQLSLQIIEPLKQEMNELEANIKELGKMLKSSSVRNSRPEETSVQLSSQIIEPLMQEMNELEANIKELGKLLDIKGDLLADDTMPLHNKTISVFYNTYQVIVPKNKTVSDTHSYDVIYDQLKRLNSGLLKDKTVYYSRFGDLSRWPIAKCTNLGSRKCIEIAATKDGGEVITLQYLYNFCQKNPNDRVVYIHSKGTHTKSWNNRILRKILMKAVTSKECLYEMGSTNEKQCKTCSSQVSAVPPHYPGNMWVADCNYINMLIPPNQYERKKSEIVTTMHNATRKLVPENDANDYYITELNNETNYTFHNGSRWMIYRDSWLGTKRYAMEHWLGSHPKFQPCDVFSPKDGIPVMRYDSMKHQRVFAAELDPKLQMAPGVKFKKSWHHPFKLHPWFKRIGKLYEYKVLYSKVPANTSWFYEFWEKVNDK